MKSIVIILLCVFVITIMFGCTDYSFTNKECQRLLIDSNSYYTEQGSLAIPRHYCVDTNGIGHRVESSGDKLFLIQ